MKRTICKLTCLLAALAMILCMVPAGVVSAAEAQEGQFTVCSMNVDGLPIKILGFVTINGDGPGSSGTKAMSAKMATYGWDIIAVSEDFNYHTELMSSLSGYSSGTHRGGVSSTTNKTDGLNLIWKNSVSVTGESWTRWNDYYATGLFGSGNGADGMIYKGYRFYQATVAEGVTVDVYTLHMDADSDAGDIEARESQLTQLANAIKASKNGNPIIVMGDTNCRYTRENLKTLFIDSINADSRFTIQDAWIEHVRGGDYPVHGSDAIVAVDKGGTYEYPQAEIVDKIFYINNTDSEVTIKADYYQIATDFVDDSGTALADHWPVVVQFTYSIAGAHEHSYQETSRVEATCTENGTITYTCVDGDDSYTETIPATGHNYDNGVVTKEATCEAAGIKTYTCANCAATYTEEIPAIGSHSYDNGVVTKAATCEAAGVKTFTCSACNSTYTEEIPATGHNYDNGVVTKAATCETAGVKTYTCSTCGKTYTEEIPATGHSYDNGVVTKAATCEEAGVKTYTCANCAATYTEVIPAGNHNYKGEVTKAATCEEAGVKTYTCANCGDSYSETIAALGHKYSVSVKNATCEEAGATTYTCANCGDSYSETIAALGHKYSASVKNATCEEAGAITYTCANCGDSYSETIAALGHSFENGVCANCGESENAQKELVIGEETKTITSGKKYVLVFSGSNGNFSMNHSGTTISAQSYGLTQGDTVEDAYVWTVTESSGKYVLSTEIDGVVYYLYRTKTFTGSGYKLGLTTTKSSATAWTASTNNRLGTLRLYVKSGFANYYLRYHNARLGWQASFSAAGIHLIQVEEG